MFLLHPRIADPLISWFTESLNREPHKIWEKKHREQSAGCLKIHFLYSTPWQSMIAFPFNDAQSRVIVICIRSVYSFWVSYYIRKIRYLSLIGTSSHLSSSRIASHLSFNSLLSFTHSPQPPHSFLHSLTSSSHPHLFSPPPSYGPTPIQLTQIRWTRVQPRTFY